MMQSAPIGAMSLSNCSGCRAASLNGLFLEGVNGTDGSVYKTAALSGLIPSDGVFVIGDDSGNGTSQVSNVDLVLDVEFQNGPDSIVLRDANGVLDALGYGDFSSAVFAGEGDAAPDVAGGWSLARGNPRVDSDDNAADFFGLDIPTPGLVPASAGAGAAGAGTVPVRVRRTDRRVAAQGLSTCPAGIAPGTARSPPDARRRRHVHGSSRG